jgi:predicted transcriptional regulator
MTPERKTTMVSVRLPAAVVARVDFVARNTEGDIKSRSAALCAAVDAWLPEQEANLEKLGILPKKVRAQA